MNTQEKSGVARSLVSQLKVTAKEALKASRSYESEHSATIRRNSANATIMGLASVTLAIGSVICLRRAADALACYREWKHEDEMLDEALSESLDSSDPTARY